LTLHGFSGGDPRHHFASPLVTVGGQREQLDFYAPS
jgi:hypothetical protein